MSESNRNAITSQAAFEEAAYKAIRNAVYAFREGDVGRLINRNIRRRLNLHRKRYAEQRFKVVRFDSKDENGKPVCKAGEATDVLANVESEVSASLIKTQMTLLAEGHLTKLAIVKHISSGLDDSASARLLAQTFGNKAESYRKKIMRFKYACRAALA